MTGFAVVPVLTFCEYPAAKLSGIEVIPSSKVRVSSATAAKRTFVPISVILPGMTASVRRERLDSA